MSSAGNGKWALAGLIGRAVHPNRRSVHDSWATFPRLNSFPDPGCANLSWENFAGDAGGDGAADPQCAEGSSLVKNRSC